MSYYERLKNLTIFRIVNYGFSFFLNRILGFVLLSLLTKHLDQNIIGQYFMFINLQTILVSASIFGIPSLIIKELSENLNSKVNGYLKYKVLFFSFLISTFLFLFFSFLINTYYAQINYKYLIFLSCLFTLYNSILFYFFISIKRIILGNFIDQILKYLLLIIFFIYLLFLNIKFTILHLILLYSVVNIITFFTFIFLIYKNKILNLEEAKKEIKYKEIKYKEYSKYFFTTGMMSLFTILNSKIDILIIKYFFDEIQVSIYGIGSQLSFIVNIPFIVISSILMPKIAALFKKDKIIQINLLCDFYRFVLLILSVFTLFLLAFFYEKLLILFFNENYLESYIVFIIIASSYLIVSLFAFNELYLTYSGQEIKIAIFMFLSCLVNIFACLILVPNYGIIGAATALSLSNIFFFFLVFILNKKNNYRFIYIIRILFKNKFWLIKKL